MSFIDQMPDVDFLTGNIVFTAQTRIQLLCQKDPKVWKFYPTLELRVAVGLSLRLRVAGAATVTGTATINYSTILAYSKSLFGQLNSNYLNSLIKIMKSPLNDIINSVLAKGLDLNSIISENLGTSLIQIKQMGLET